MAIRRVQDPTDGSVLPRGDTPLHSYRREGLMQEIIWLYNPELAGKLFQIDKMNKITHGVQTR